jgi:hypothetical protein
MSRTEDQTGMDRASTDLSGRTENDLIDPALAHALLVIPERGFRVLRVIYDETVSPVRIVTLYFDEEVSDL